MPLPILSLSQRRRSQPRSRCCSSRKFRDVLPGSACTAARARLLVPSIGLAFLPARGVDCGVLARRLGAAHDAVRVCGRHCFRVLHPRGRAGAFRPVPPVGVELREASASLAVLVGSRGAAVPGSDTLRDVRARIPPDAGLASGLVNTTRRVGRRSGGRSFDGCQRATHHRPGAQRPARCGPR